VTGRVVLVTDDAGSHLAIGPVCTKASLERLRQEVSHYGWTAEPTVPHYSRADFTCARGRGEGLIREAWRSPPGILGSRHHQATRAFSRSVIQVVPPRTETP
jgi:hypothetical protein